MWDDDQHDDGADYGGDWQHDNEDSEDSFDETILTDESQNDSNNNNASEGQRWASSGGGDVSSYNNKKNPREKHRKQQKKNRKKKNNQKQQHSLDHLRERVSELMSIYEEKGLFIPLPESSSSTTSSSTTSDCSDDHDDGGSSIHSMTTTTTTTTTKTKKMNKKNEGKGKVWSSRNYGADKKRQRKNVERQLLESRIKQLEQQLLSMSLSLTLEDQPGKKRGASHLP